jgi:uncharacterized protein (UPF0264 family)
MHLLVSIQNRHEALSALTGGADIVDAKDPATGALGAVSLNDFRGIAARVRGAAIVTAAIGDADDEASVEQRAHAFAAAGAVFVKIGFAGLAREHRVLSMIRAAQAGASSAHGALVTVAYADHGSVAAPSPELVVSAAATAGAEGVLLDTARKDGPGLLKLCDERWLRQWVSDVHAAGMFAAVAGRLHVGDLAVVQAVEADIAGVRGAACDGGRTGTISVARVRQLVSALSVPTHHRSSTVWPGRWRAGNTGRRGQDPLRRQA